MPQIGSATIGQIANSSEIVKHLFLAELVRLDGVLNGIIDKNDRINGVDVSAGFLHQGSSISVLTLPDLQPMVSD